MKNHYLRDIPRGEKHHKSKMTNDDVKLMRECWETGKFSTRELGEKFELNNKTVWGIVTYRTWRHVL